MNEPRTQIHRTMCPMNCHPTLCGMTVAVAGGKVTSIAGDESNPDSEGFLCIRGRAAHEILDNPKRLLHPLMRDRRGGGDWREASWDDVLDRIAGDMQRVGREAVAFWPGHGNGVNDYGVGLKGQLIQRFANLYGCQTWSPAMVCWGLGGFGLGLTGALETSTKEDMSANSALILLWGANLTSQPNTARHLAAARRRGAHIVAIDVRSSEATAQADEALTVPPGSDTELALALMHVIIGEGLVDRDFVAAHTVGFDALAEHVRAFTPERTAARTGLDADRIVGLARRYATTKPAILLVGGSSLHKGANAWLAARAISCLPALTGNFGVPGGGIGPRHGAHSHGRGLGSVVASAPRKPGTYIADQMPDIAAALADGRIRALFTVGTNMLSSFPDAGTVALGLDRADLVVAHDIFMNDTAWQFADIVLPGTIWLEEVGCKATNTHLYLMDRILPPAGEARPFYQVLQGLAERLGVDDFFPWPDYEAALDTVLDHPATGHATVAGLRAGEGRVALNISHVAYPTHEYDTPSGRIEFVSERAAALGLPALPVPPDDADVPGDEPVFPLTLAFGRTLTQFHSFYDKGAALPTLAERDPAPLLWISPGDATDRNIGDGDGIRIHNARGAFAATARVTDRIGRGTVWMRDGWTGMNALTSGDPVVPAAALNLFPFTVGQSSFAARVEVSAA